MRRTQIYLDEGQDAALAERAEELGRTKCDVIREAIDGYLDRANGVDPDAEFRAALRAAAGCAPYLPDGATYVNEIRGFDVERQRVH